MPLQLLQTTVERFMPVTNMNPDPAGIYMNLDKLILLLQVYSSRRFTHTHELNAARHEIVNECLLLLPLLQNTQAILRTAIGEMSRMARELGELQGCKDLIEKFDLISDWREHSESLEGKVKTLTKRNQELEVRLDASLRLLKSSNIAFDAVSNAVENEVTKPYHGRIPPKQVKGK